MLKRTFVPAAVIAISAASYVWLGYFTVRTDFYRIIAAYAVLFGLYLVILRHRSFSKYLGLAIGGAMLLRLVLLFMTPNLSDDYFRFIWDGLIVANGGNPYLSTPADLVQASSAVPGISTALFEQLNSPHFYSAYPPVIQFFFGLGGKLFGGDVFANVIVLRVVVLLAEFGTIILLYKITKALRWSSSPVLLYAFNPLVIIELTGNLHPEAIMIFFLVLSIYLLIKDAWLLSAVVMGVSIGVKLIPLLFLPLLIKRLGTGRSLRYYAVTGITLVLACLPFFNLQAISNYFSSLLLYFRVFEFNASVHYVVRWVGKITQNQDVLTVAGTVLPVLTFLVCIGIAIKWKGKDWPSLFRNMLVCLTVYLLFSSNVHAWNLTPLVLLAALTRYRYVLVWSLLIPLMYVTYQNVPYTENLWLVAIEYVAVAGWAAYEVWFARGSRDLVGGAESRML